MLRILHIAGARPNFVKIGPVIEAFSRFPEVEQHLVHTGQHYDDALSAVFFDQMRIPRPDVNLEVGSGSHAVQTARIMMAFESVCVEWEPDLIVVVGDVNSTLACALVAAKLGIKVAHVEAGLRSFDWDMPEEINRVLTDRLSDFLFTTESSGNENLMHEGFSAKNVHFVGNVMVDALFRHREEALALRMPERLGLEPRGYALVTLHRPSNVDSVGSLRTIFGALEDIADSKPVVFPVHPRTRERIRSFGIEVDGPVQLLEPLGYLEFVGLMGEAGLVLTDSGGIQEETTALGVPCLTLRPNTERPVTLEHGTNRLVPIEREEIVCEALAAINGASLAVDPTRRLPELWDGQAAKRIAEIIVDSLAGSQRTSIDDRTSRPELDQAIRRGS